MGNIPVLKMILPVVEFDNNNEKTFLIFLTIIKWMGIENKVIYCLNMNSMTW